MSSGSFSLKPYPSAVHLPGIQITGSIERSFNTISVSYALLGPAAELSLPAPSERPARRNSLWEETCFELFLGIKNSGVYWEFNLSPAGHWNVYRFKAYRQGMQEEPAIISLPFRTEHQADAFRLSLEIDLNKVVPADQVLEAGVSAVIKSINGGLTYWALVHHGAKADFHRRDGFIIEL